MAKYTGTIDFPPLFEQGVPFDTSMQRQEAALDRLQQVSDSLPEGETVGAVLSFQRGDGYATYVVTSEKPLELKHVPFCDAWHISAAEIRGLRKSDVLEHLSRRKAFVQLFNRNA